MRNALKKHWPEYLMEAAELGIFMISAGLFTILLYHPASPVVRAIPQEFNRTRRSAIAAPQPMKIESSSSSFLPPFLCLLVLGSSFCLGAAPVVFQSSENQTTLLELYTSEGCSSCPPAEAWLSRLKESPGLWRDFVPVAFHVDYWDYLGWRDPWSSSVFTDRQHAYAGAWRSDSVYTPGFVLNGKEWRAWPRYNSVPLSTVKAGVLKVTSADLKIWHVSFTPSTPSSDSCEAHAVLLASGLTSDVKAGENKGRRLAHDFVVISLNGCLLKPEGHNLQGGFELKRANKEPAKAGAIAVWVSQPGALVALQATGGWLPSAP